MKRINLFLLTLSFSILFGVDDSQELSRDVVGTQDNHQMNKEMDQNPMPARKAGIPKPDTFQKKLRSNSDVFNPEKFSFPDNITIQDSKKTFPPKNKKRSSSENSLSSGKENNNQKRLNSLSRARARTTVESTL